ncbi:MAG: hypothetical protein ISQ70_01400 [Pirellulales bacterium]|jgi:xanthine/CO dehydrogenase XdhC/CoxF family maturation factor|nr:hypothetical protein [Pirellulales bacterium]MBL7192367.1 hypothetical protein [Pirellulales bacterium]MDA0816020.1 hypothetical protein [Planctomycetota bacterium]MDA0968965.1 hypothetical protein [Planctomycetota bacterium]
MPFTPILAHHVEINLFDVVVIEPETMPEHAALAAATAVVVALLAYGLRAAIRDSRSRWGRPSISEVA